MIIYSFNEGRILKKLGHVHTMTMILLVMGIRLLAYSYLVNPWYTLPIDLLNGLTLGVYWSTVRIPLFYGQLFSNKFLKTLHLFLQDGIICEFDRAT